MRRLLCILLSFIIAFSFIPTIAFADDEVSEGCEHVWKAGTAESDYVAVDVDTHKHIYYCVLCGDKKGVSEEHDFATVNYKSYDDSQHRRLLVCNDCDKTKYLLEAHDLESSVEYDYHPFNSKYHVTETIKYCEICWNGCPVAYKKEAHRFGWVGGFGGYYYCCKDCYEDCDDYEYAESKTKSVTVKKSGTHKLTYRCTTHDKLKSASVTSGTSVVKISSKGNSSLTYKCKKKGKAVIKVKMYSGATYTFKIKVK